MVDFCRDIDFSKYNTFILEYMSDGDFSNHNVRPTTATYKEITDTSKFRTYTLEGAVISFTQGTKLSEIFCECAVRGIPIDFVDVLVLKDDKNSWSDRTISQVIDTHKEDISKYLEKIEAKRYYVAKNASKRDIMRFLVIDRFGQSNDVEFLKGEYDKKAIVASFREYSDALEYCGRKNGTFNLTI